ncbi:N-acetyl-gamma-glutamyl-phosphate reductase [Labilibaculum antarcticum]|uniref:N-acetyl-gamma-glutamyl-phosphate reductase n=1 Tax=Labilibaculum antarcticum TaxID=1717717 RepID=A0A1Y1CIL4_9BACT|nr:N-acetyl-gamma-glutamyl-phosphate reductase [Labilibaculum antarcticum]BAX79923.1 N-acetyl-gamma-glutamyl-phosphate reductase [Labilibaculum antarcticum]
MTKKKIGIIGATGYTGSELVRILTNHPDVEISMITSESRTGELFSDVHPFLQGIADQKLVSVNQIDEYELDLVFLALPHGVSMDFVKRFKDKSFKIIDLSGDFRLSTQEVYEEWYKIPHIYPKGIEKAVFGSPELYFDEIKQAHLIANPGCFPTSAILGLAPLLKANLIETDRIIVDSKTGVTGAGIKAKTVNLYSNVNDNFKAYGLKNHRHTIEIQGVLDKVSGKNTCIQFTPHLLPVDRGILTSIYVRPTEKLDEIKLKELYADFYANAPFVRLRKQEPAIKDVRGTNYCDLYVTYDERTNMVIIISVIDNLIKGAAGQAVQNMNIMFGLEETKGLNLIPLNP